MALINKYYGEVQEDLLCDQIKNTFTFDNFGVPVETFSDADVDSDADVESCDSEDIE